MNQMNLNALLNSSVVICSVSGCLNSILEPDLPEVPDNLTSTTCAMSKSDLDINMSGGTSTVSAPAQAEPRAPVTDLLGRTDGAEPFMYLH